MFISKRRWREINRDIYHLVSRIKNLEGESERRFSDIEKLRFPFFDKQIGNLTRELRDKTVLATRSRRPDPIDMGVYDLVPVNEAIEKILDYFGLKFKRTMQKDELVKKEETLKKEKEEENKKYIKERR